MCHIEVERLVSGKEDANSPSEEGVVSPSEDPGGARAMHTSPLKHDYSGEEAGGNSVG